MAEVELKQISKIYNDEVRAVDNISFTVKDKEFVVLVGPSGCGKSTTLRMIAGLEEISEGQLLIDGEVVNDLSPGERKLSMVFQNYALYPHMTAYQNMAFGLKISKTPKAEIRERVRQAAEILNIEELLQKKPGKMSGGQRQRVAIGRAIVRRPKLFLFDEPLSNLDAELRTRMRIEIARLHQALDATMIYVTHDQVEAMTLGDRIAVMKAGRIMQIDAPMELYNNPGNKFVAGFIGTPAMNFLLGSLQKRADRLFFHTENWEADISSLQLQDAGSYLDSSVYLGFRAEALFPPSLSRPTTVPLPAQIVGIELLGNEKLVYLKHQATPLVARFASSTDTELNTSISLQLDIQQAFVFAQADGARVY